ncbi:MAG: hcpC 1 [Verrucomicrobiales bacterium]|nr:hcpC 1 [Verrucomicrobiales bacterium]
MSDPINKFALIILAAVAVLTGCATTDKVVLDSSKRSPTTAVDVFKGKVGPTTGFKSIAELSFLGPREDELKATSYFIDEAKKLGGNGILFSVDYAGIKGGGTLFQTTAWVFKAKVIVYEEAKEGPNSPAAYFKNLDMDKIRIAAARGEPMAQFNMGLASLTGQGGLKEDSGLGKIWLEKAADQNLDMAINALAALYEEGHGVPKDSAKALELFQKAASLGNASAQTTLGFRYANGTQVLQDFVEAYKWWSLAAAQGDTVAIQNRETLAKRLTPDQIAESQKRAASMLKPAKSIQ